MQKGLILLLLFTNFIMSSERFTNTNNAPNERSFKEFLKWTLTSKNPERVQIETSKEWKNLDQDYKNHIVWIGHATFLINVDGINILTDPVFSKRASPLRLAGPKRYIPPAIPLDKLPAIDLVTVSHNHYDHLDIRSLKKLFERNKGTVFLVPKGDKQLLQKQGIKNVYEFLWWEDKEFNSGLKFTYTPVQHWSARGLRDRNKSLWGGWFMKFPERTIYHAGDTGYSKDFIETRKKLGSPDLSLIPIGAYAPQWFMSYSHVNPEEAVQISQDLGSKQSLAMHWGTFPLTDEEVLEPPALLKKALEAKNLDEEYFITLKPGEVFNLSPQEP